MSARWRVTWTRERHKKKPRKRDGRLDVDAASRSATLYDEKENDDGTISFEVVAREKLPPKTWETLESGAEIALGGVGVYLDDLVDRGGGGGAESVEATKEATKKAGAERAKRHRHVNPAFQKKFVPPMLKRAKTRAPMVVNDDVDDDARDGGENEPKSDLAKLLQMFDGDVDAAIDMVDRNGGEAKKPIALNVKAKPVVHVPFATRPAPQSAPEATTSAPARRVSALGAAAAPAQMSTDVCVTFPSYNYAGSEFPRAQTFATVREYQAYFVSAICENLMLRLRDVSSTMHKLRTDGAQSAQKPDLLAKILWHRYKLRYFTQCEISSRKWTDKVDNTEKTCVRLMVKDFKSIKGPKPYAKGDFWIVSTEPWFEVKPLQEIGDRHRAPWLGVVECKWHGMDNEGRMEVQLLGPRPPRLRDNATIHVYAMHTSLNAFSETDELENILSLSAGRPSPLIDSILGKPPPKELEEEAELYLKDADIGVAPLQRSFKLNDDQARAVSGALASATPASHLPVRLIHGPFGSGKTHTIAAFVTKAAELLKSSNGRIMIAAHTNVAVDRVLQSLLEAGFTDFIRVGSVRKIDPVILPYSLHVKTGKGPSQAKELEAMLKETTSVRKRAILQKEIETLSSGKVGMRKALLKKCSVVGVTCYSSSHEDLKNMEFSVVVLDECSQMTEPSSLLPVVQSRCKTLVAVGDPLQLSPVVADVPESNRSKANVTRNPLKRTLFSRLSDAGHSKVTLRTQYRLHPALSAVPNKCFYDGVLIDGIGASDRTSLIRLTTGGVLSPIVWWDTSGFDTKEGQSKLNVEEATRVSGVVRCLLDNDVPAGRIGVIAFYAAQASCVSNKLAHAPHDVAREMTNVNDDEDFESFLPSDVQVSTVDAFQGQEKDVIIITLCGAPLSTFTNAERLNVALTRAKRHLIVVGAAAVAQKSNVSAWVETLKRARSTPNGYIPLSYETNAVLQKWSPAVKESVEHDDVLLSPSSEIAPSPRFLNDRETLLELGFDQKRYWDFYCAVMRGVNYDHKQSRATVTESPLRPFIQRVFPRVFDANGDIEWSKAKVKRALSIDVIGLLRRFIEYEHGSEWGTLDKLIDAFEDREEFERDPTGFGWMCVQEAEGAVAVGDCGTGPTTRSDDADEDSWNT